MRSTPGAPRAHRGDVLQVQSGPSVVPANPESRLEKMGFRVSRQTGEHWIVTGTDPLPEFHFYSSIELGRFTLNQATRYQEWLNRRHQHDITTPLSG